MGAKRSDEVYASVWNPATTKRGVHGGVLFLFPLKWAVRPFHLFAQVCTNRFSRYKHIDVIRGL